MFFRNIAGEEGVPGGGDASGPGLESVLNAILERHGYDFRDYARPTLDRRILAFMQNEGIRSFGEFRVRVLSGNGCMRRLLQAMSVRVTAMFRDPGFYRAFRREVVPMLRTYPFIRIWHAGCSSGQEVYSMAILMAEEGLYDRCRIYATDMDESALRKAREGIYSPGHARRYTADYLRSGGRGVFSDYYTAKYDSVIINSSLRRNIVFGQHNLVTDGSFNEFQVVLCRNVLIFFNARLQERVLGLIHQSLGMFGYLGLGWREAVGLGAFEDRFQVIDSENRFFRKIT
jgi:chemotaxis protein methyltransferase CheR